MNTSRKRYLILVGLLAILAASAYLRYCNLETNPGWDQDEGYNLNIAWNLAQGRMQMYATTFAFVQHPPLFYLILAPLFNLFGASILVLRGLTATYGVLATAMLYLVGKEIAGPKIGLLASGLFAIYPVAVIHNRWGYSYNQLMLVALLVLYFASKHLRSAEHGSTAYVDIHLAGFLAGLGMVSDQEGISLVVGVVLLAWFTARARFKTVVLASVALPLLYALSMLYLAPAAFLFDWLHNWGRVSGGNLLGQALLLGINYQTFLEFDYWLPLGLMGLFLVPARKIRVLLIVFVSLMLLVILKIRPVNPYFRTAVPVLPFVCLGLAILVDRAFDYVHEWVMSLSISLVRRPAARSVVAVLAVFLILFTPFSAAAVLDIVQVQTALRTKIDDVLVKSPADARAAARFVSSRSSPEDIALVSPSTSWLYTNRTADLLQAVAAEGKSTAFYPPDMPADRFVYDPRYANARFVVLDHFSDLWAASMPEEARIVREVRASWPVVFRSGEYVVYQNPAL